MLDITQCIKMAVTRSFYVNSKKRFMTEIRYIEIEKVCQVFFQQNVVIDFTVVTEARYFVVN